MAENLRWMDLKRWRSFDQLITNPYHIEGIHIWNTPMQDWYDQKILKETISSESLSEYLRPYEGSESSEVFNGLTWSMAHYWRPIPIFQFTLTSDDGKYDGSIIYQNPYWPTEPNMPATK